MKKLALSIMAVVFVSGQMVHAQNQPTRQEIQQKRSEAIQLRGEIAKFEQELKDAEESELGYKMIAIPAAVLALGLPIFGQLYGIGQEGSATAVPKVTAYMGAASGAVAAGAGTMVVVRAVDATIIQYQLMQRKAKLDAADRALEDMAADMDGN